MTPTLHLRFRLLALFAFVIAAPANLAAQQPTPDTTRTDSLPDARKISATAAALRENAPFAPMCLRERQSIDDRTAGLTAREGI